MPTSIVKELEDLGIARLPQLVSPETLRDMQTAFASRLSSMRWNDNDGYERTERFRLMIQDVLTLAQGFVTIALHPLVKEVLRGYLGESFELVEAKGWQSLPTKKDFHGWHGDAWYDQDKVKDRIPREVKLAFYLSDVESGAFQYIKGSHGKVVPRLFSKHEAQDLPMDQMVTMTGPAGSAFLFDTSGIHRQGMPILQQRQAVFLNYHDPAVPLQGEDVEYYRYHPLLLNAAFLGDLGAEDYSILGFGNKTNYVPAFQRRSGHRGFQAFMRMGYTTKLFAGEFRRRLTDKMRRLLKR
jgi:Phytanoyl-CoA dioxygenase (PhyH)